jgi:hypothetical protein
VLVHLDTWRSVRDAASEQTMRAQLLREDAQLRFLVLVSACLLLAGLSVLVLM